MNDSVKRELSRRDLMALGGLAAPIGAYVVACKFKAQHEITADDIGEAIGPQRLSAEPSEIVAEIAKERPGTLMVRCQLFWPIYRRREKLAELESACRNSLKAGTYADPYQVHALPSLAHIHALGSCDFDERAAHEAYVISAHRAARKVLSDEFVRPDREVLELIWRSMIGSVTRNISTWQAFVVGEEILSEAVALIQCYMDGEEILFSPAILAWQFLLTYEKAIKARRGDGNEVWKAITSVISQNKNPKTEWFTEPLRLYSEKDSLDDVYPQYAETFMAYSFDLFEKEIREYAAKVVLQKLFINHSVGSGSQYVPLPRIAEYERIWPDVVKRYGFNRAEWERMRDKSSGIKLSPKAVEYVNSQLTPGGPANETVMDAVEQIRARTLSFWVPFRKRDEEKIFSAVYGEQSLEELLRKFSSQSDEKLRDVWTQTIGFEGVAMAEHCNLYPDRAVTVDSSFKLISDKRIKEHLEIAREFCDRARSFLKTAVLVTSIGIAPQLSSELVINELFESDPSDSAGAPKGAPRMGVPVATAADLEQVMSAENIRASDSYPAGAAQAAIEMVKELRQFRRQHPEARNFTDSISAVFFKHTGKTGPLEEAWQHIRRCESCRALYEEFKSLQESFLS